MRLSNHAPEASFGTHLIGWTLEDAREALETDAVTRDLELHIVMTSPPQRRNQAMPGGAQRVLRVRRAPAQKGRPTLSLLVAREQTLDDTAISDETPIEILS